MHASRTGLGLAARAAVVLLAVVLASPATAAAELPADRSWHDLDLDQVDDRESWLLASWAGGDESVHVGVRQALSGGETVRRPVVHQCVRDDCRLTFPTDVGPPGRSLWLEGVAGTSPTDVWAVGFAFVDEYQTRPSSWRWDGSTWTEVVVPVPTGSMHDVSAAAVDDVWASGSQGVSEPAIWRWNGSE